MVRRHRGVAAVIPRFRPRGQAHEEPRALPVLPRAAIKAQPPSSLSFPSLCRRREPSLPSVSSPNSPPSVAHSSIPLALDSALSLRTTRTLCRRLKPPASARTATVVLAADKTPPRFTPPWPAKPLERAFTAVSTPPNSRPPSTSSFPATTVATGWSNVLVLPAQNTSVAPQHHLALGLHFAKPKMRPHAPILPVQNPDRLRVRIQNQWTWRQILTNLVLLVIMPILTALRGLRKLFRPQRPERLELGPEAGQRPGAQEAVSEVAKRLEGILNQCYAACLPTCAMSYPLLKDAPDSVKLIMYVGLSSITLTVYIGMVSKSEARARLAIRLVSCTAVTVLTFSVASLLSAPTYVVVFTALAAGAMNLIILLLPI